MTVEAERDDRPSISWSYAHTECAILCGGRGRRLGGVDKGLLPHRDTTFLGHLTDVGLTLSPHVMWVRPSMSVAEEIELNVSRDVKHKRLTLRSDQSIREVQDLAGVGGVLGAIGAALIATTRPWLWVLACDLPLLRSDDLLALIDKARLAHPQTRCVAYKDTHTHKVHPLCALWRSDQATHLVAEINRRRGGLHSYIQRYGEVVSTSSLSSSGNLTEELARPVISPFFNVNYPEDLARVPELIAAQDDSIQGDGERVLDPSTSRKSTR